METLKFNGEYFYTDGRSIVKRIRQWFIWFGGWERANAKGWKFRIDYGHRIGWLDPYPISILGHMATFFSWGFRVRLTDNYWFTCSSSGLYVSSDGTPPDAGNYEKRGFYILKLHKE